MWTSHELGRADYAVEIPIRDGVYWVGGGEEASELVTTYTKVMDWRWVKASETTRGNITSISRQNNFYYHPLTGALIVAQYGTGGANEYSKTYTFTAEGNLQNLTTSDGTSVGFEYDGTKTMVVRQERVYAPGMSHVDSMAVDVGLGVVVDGWSPNGELTHSEYDGFGRPTATTIYPGTPSARGTIQSGYGADTRWTYHDGELPLRVVIETRQSAQSSADDYSTKVELYDLNGGLVQTATSATLDEAGLDRYAIVRTISDYSNRRTSVYGPFYAASTVLVSEAAIPDSSRMTESHFDYLGRSVRDVRRNRQYGEVETTYDFTARSVEVTDPVDRSAAYIWNAAGRIVSQVGSMAGSSGYSRMIYQYNTAGDLTAAINYNASEYFLREYDWLGGLTEETGPDVGTRSFLRWSNGELKRVTEQDGKTRLYYRDGTLRKTKVAYSRTGAEDVFGYDDESVDNAIGRMTRSSGPGYTWSALGYDMYGNCTADSVWVSGSLPFVAGYDHRPGGEPSLITYPGGGETQYTYYPNTELLESATLSYAGTELRSEFRDFVPSGKAKTIEYFADGSEAPFLRLNRDIGWADGMLYRITAIATPDAAPDTVLDVLYSYIEDGNLGFSADRTIADHKNLAAPAWITRYEYDFASRLTREYDNGATTPNREVTYSTDRPRFETLRSASRTLSYSYDWSHPYRPQTLSVGASIYNLTYDSRGNVATDVHLENFITPTVRHLTYDVRGQVSRIEIDTPILAAEIFEDCLYSPEGRMVRQSDSFGGSVIRPYTFYEVNSDNVLRYLEADGVSVGYINTSATQNTIAVFVHDRRGDVRAVVDGNGAAISEFEYGAWGKTTVIGSSEISGRRFGGKIYDGLARFTDFGARKYESSYGLFLAPDAFTTNAFDYIDLNRYAYARFNPMRNIDPNGNWVETLWDITQVGMGAVSLYNNVKEGNVGAAIIDGAGLVLDVGAAVLPLVPAGASTGIKAARAGDYVATAVRWGDDLVDTAKVGVRELGERASGRASQAWGAVRGVFRRGGDDAVEVTTRAARGAGRGTTRFVDGARVVDRRTGQVVEGTVDLKPTLDRIKSGGSFPHRNDGSVFRNSEGLLPSRPEGYYREFVHPTPGVRGPGPQRVVQGQGGELFYTPDHYGTFIPLN